MVVLVGHRQELVVVDFHHKRNLVGVLAAQHGQSAKGGRDGIALGLDGQLNDVLGVEINRVRGEAGSGAVFHALIHGQDAEVARIRESAGSVKGLQGAQGRVAAVA
jgi:hypothetical protein